MEAPKAPPTPSAGGIVRLNIGGVHLCTTAATLLSHGDNFFSGLLSGRFQALTDETGAYFIDRCGRAFEPLLDYLRNGTLIIPPHVSLDSVLLEAQYFLIDISSALSGMLRSGLYSGRNVGGADVAILFVEKDPAFPAQVAVTGVIEGYLCFEHVCPIEQGKVVLRIPSSEFLLQPAEGSSSLRCWCPTKFRSQRLLDFLYEPSTAFPLPGRDFSFEYPVDEVESDFNRGFLSFIDTSEEMVARVQMGGGSASIYAVQVLCASVVMLSTATKPYALVYLSGKVPFLFTSRRGTVKACVLKRIAPPAPAP